MVHDHSEQNQWLPVPRWQILESRKEKQEALWESSAKCMKDTLKKRKSQTSFCELTEKSILASSMSCWNMFSFRITNSLIVAEVTKPVSKAAEVC